MIVVSGKVGRKVSDDTRESCQSLVCDRVRCRPVRDRHFQLQAIGESDVRRRDDGSIDDFSCKGHNSSLLFKGPALIAVQHSARPNPRASIDDGSLQCSADWRNPQFSPILPPFLPSCLSHGGTSRRLVRAGRAARPLLDATRNSSGAGRAAPPSLRSCLLPQEILYFFGVHARDQRHYAFPEIGRTPDQATVCGL